MTATRNLRIYWASRLIAGASGTAAPVVLAVSTLSASVGASVLAPMLSAQAVGQLVALATAGIIIDRVNRQAFLVCVQMLAGLTWAAFALLLFTDAHNPTLWIGIGALLGLLAGLNGPATHSLLSFLVDRDAMKTVVANIRISLNIVALLSPVVAGAAIAVLPPGVVPLAMAIFMAVSALTLCALPAMRSRASEGPEPSGLRDILQGWFVIIVLTTSAMNLLWAGFFQLRGPIAIAGEGGTGAAEWGIVSASFAAGLIAGGVYYRRATFRDPVGTPLLLLAPKALPILVIAVYPHAIVLSIAAAVAGFFLEAFAVNFATQMQLRMPQHALGKALSLDGFIGIGLLPLGYAAADATARAGMTELSGILAAVGTLLLAVLGWALLRWRGSQRGAIGSA
ncbi:MAG: MFS transporter [Dermabacter sp.]|nr:MFS transporter [Dermabacter sp.]